MHHKLEMRANTADRHYSFAAFPNLHGDDRLDIASIQLVHTSQLVRPSVALAMECRRIWVDFILDCDA